MANIVRWDDPFAGLTSLHSQLDDMFNNMFMGLPSMPLSQTIAPAMDVYKEGDNMVLEVHAPGFTKDDVDVNVQNGVLEIKGEKHEKEEDKKGKKDRNYMLRESHASFYRRISLPDNANEDKVDAKFEDGLLKITVPFKELPKPKKVAISSGKK